MLLTDWLVSISLCRAWEEVICGVGVTPADDSQATWPNAVGIQSGAAQSPCERGVYFWYGIFIYLCFSISISNLDPWKKHYCFFKKMQKWVEPAMQNTKQGRFAFHFHDVI